MSTPSHAVAPWRLLRLLGLGRSPLSLAAPLVRPLVRHRPADGIAPIRVRCAGIDVPLEAGAVAEAFAHASDCLVVFVPGVDEDETVWHQHLDQVGGTYASRLSSLLGWTPVHLLVATVEGEDSRSQGVAVAAALQLLVDAWPVDVRRIALVGHGTGGLVLRTACALQDLAAGPWRDRVSDVVLLGTPHLVVPSGRSLVPGGRLVDEELAGIVTEDRVDAGLDPLPGARYVVVTARTRLQQSRVGGVVGELFWWRHRLPLRARRARSLFPTATLHHVPTHEVGLANHPDVHQALVTWLA
ncbi:hypothetical protein ncot_05205 [Nocardioides sp. JQ2195]|uniref:esterase/lipase family protein n=1 Tax=Nocardioides sp. JQ2195 TaxID=2592334 RepID=UPI00143E9316|nr:hypothetical protein [Nocardioides sp. JQ2195]QIX26065.1 hypothetical protein ncot_05205 [Nocardioides sp. JQ2195]